MQASPPLFPFDAGARREIEEAESWGENTLQEVPRRLFRWALVRDRDLRLSLAQANGMPMPGLFSHLLKPVARRFAGISGADDASVRRDLQALPSLLDHADDLIGQEVIGASRPNAATFQIVPSLRLLMNLRQLEPTFDGRPCARLAEEMLPDYPGQVGDVFPADWVPRA